ncbi:MAG: type II toxin-antitoxin system RelE/ParE family toxin [Acidobacteria bacterium]|nr:type II toxin-antitoxin system RelE/ParE family toxin [Acidobacteriota bacterium]
MSDAKVEFTPEALREIDDAFEWYLERSLQVAEAFVQEVDRAVALIASSPTI